jgi:putative transposase
LAFDKSTVVKEYKDEIETLQHEKDAIAKKLGETIVEKDFLVEKLKSLASSKERITLIDTKLNISLNKQCQLLHVSKSSLYYTPTKPFSSGKDLKVLDAINNIYSVPQGHFLTSFTAFSIIWFSKNTQPTVKRWLQCW